MIQALGWLISVLVLATYAATVHTKDARWFDWGNVVLCLPLAACEFYYAAYFTVILTMAFGVIGAAAIIKKEQPAW